MGKILDGGVRTTQAVRREIQDSQESIKILAERYYVNSKTIVKWRKRKQEGVEDQKTGPKHKFNTQLTTEDEAIIIAFRQKTQLPLDDCFDSLKEIIPILSRSSLYR